MEIQQLSGFLAVVKHRNFSKAARSTFRTQPAVSLQIQALEQELGIKLFERIGKRTVRLTEEGKILAELAEPAVRDFQSLKERFEDARGSNRHVSIRMATHGSVMEYLLPDAIRTFLRKFPDAGLQILSRSREGVIELLESGEVDIGITSLSKVPARLDYKTFAKFRRMLICPMKHRLARVRPVTLEEIAGAPIILPPEGSNTRMVIESTMAARNLSPNVAMEISGHAAVKTYVRMGLGIAVLNEYYLRKEDRRTLAVRDVSRIFGHAERGIVTRKGCYLSSATQELIRLISEGTGFRS